jgi:hypothetical protein
MPYSFRRGSKALQIEDCNSRLVVALLLVHNLLLLLPQALQIVFTYDSLVPWMTKLLNPLLSISPLVVKEAYL